MGQGAAMVAGRSRHHATGRLPVVEQGHGIAGAAQLEAAGDLLGFELQVDRHAEPGRQARRMLQRRAAHQVADALAGLEQVDQRKTGLGHVVVLPEVAFGASLMSWFSPA
ncbi:hypothetical protein D9M71_779400 [compost metagenome]